MVSLFELTDVILIGPRRGGILNVSAGSGGAFDPQLLFAVIVSEVESLDFLVHLLATLGGVVLGGGAWGFLELGCDLTGLVAALKALAQVVIGLSRLPLLQYLSLRIMITVVELALLIKRALAIGVAQGVWRLVLCQ